MHVDYFDTLANLLDDSETAFGEFSEPTSDDYYSTVSPSTTTSSTVLSPSGATNFDGSAVASSSSELDDLLDRMLEIQPAAVATSSYNNCGSYFGGSVDLSNNSIISSNNQNASGHVFLLQGTTNNAMMTDSLLLEAAAAAQHWSNELAATTGTSTATRCSLPLSDYYYHHHHHHHGAVNHQAQQFTLPNFYPAVLPTMGSAAVIAAGDSSYYTAQQQQPQHHQTVSSAPRSTTLPYVLPHSHHHHHQQQHQRYHHHASAVGTTPCEENAIADSAQQQCYVAGQFGADGADVYAMAANQQQQQQQQQSRRSLRFPFERTVSSPEFYGPLHYVPDLTNLHAGHSQSMPTFDNNNSTSAATLDMELHHHLPNYTPSPENLSTGSRSPTYYNSGSSFGYFCSSPSGVMHQPPTLLNSQKSLPLNQLCAVCGDSAQCQHYGVRTCEGCKGFFKRTVQKKSKYVCLGAKDCVIDKRRRNRCQYCRFQKCLTVGMVREVVRTDSLKGRRGRLPSKSKNTEEYAMPGGGALSLTKALYQAFTCADVGQSASTPTIGRADQLVDSINASLVAVQRLAEKIPGWAKLTLSDRLTLLHNGAVNVLSLKLAHLSMNVAVERRIVFDDGYMYIVDNCDEHWRSWLESILDLSKNLKSVFDKDITGFCCLSGIALLKHENLHMENVEEVDKLKNNVINCLKEHCTYSAEAKNKPSQYFATILSKLSDLTAVASKAGECYASCKWDGVQLPMVVDEIFARIGGEQKCCLILP